MFDINQCDEYQNEIQRYYSVDHTVILFGVEDD